METYYTFLEETNPTISTDMFIIWSSIINSVYFQNEIGLYTDTPRLNKLLQVAEQNNVVVPTERIKKEIEIHKNIWNIRN